MTAKRVEAAVAAIAPQHPSLAEWAQVAADGLTAGEGDEGLCQAVVQDFLWYRLPAKHPDHSWRLVTKATEALMGGLGLERYASIAASEASGVKPPDTELLAWGSVMGFDEASAYAQLEMKLEEVRPPWVNNLPSGPNITSLNAAGRAAALDYLRARATAPRTSLHT